MDATELKESVRRTFDTVAEGYDNPALRFFANAASLLPGVFGFDGDERVLDVACGTGTPAMAMAAHVPRGKITAVDFSAAMLDRARAKAVAQGRDNIEFARMDMTDMAFAQASFDAANCSFGLFFIEDMPALLRHIASKVKPGGTIVTTHFHQGSFAPLAEMFYRRLEDYGVNAPPVRWERVDSEQKNHALCAAAGLQAATTQRCNVGYALRDVHEWWNVVWFAGFRGLLTRLAPQQLESFKAEHLADVTNALRGEDLALNVEVIVTRARR